MPDSRPEGDEQEPRAAGKPSPGKNSLVPSATGIRRAAMDWLARREHCRHELEQRLGRRFPGATAAIGPVLDELEHEGLLSDARYVASLVRRRAATGHGPQRIRAELRQQGIDGSAATGDVDWLARAREVRTRRFGEALPADAASRARQMAFLQRRGFPAGICRAACLPPRED